MVTSIRRVKWRGGGSRSRSQPATTGPRYFPPSSATSRAPMFSTLARCQSKLPGGGDERYRLTSSRSRSWKICCASKWTRRPLRNAKPTAAPRPAGCVPVGSNRPQAPRIWSICSVLSTLLVAVGGAAALKDLGGPIELAAVAVDRRQDLQGLLAVPGLRVVGDRPEDPDELELLGELEPTDPDGQPGDRLVVSEGVQRIRGRRPSARRRTPRSRGPAPRSSACRTGR